MEWGDQYDDWDVKPREASVYINYNAYPEFDNLTTKDLKEVNNASKPFEGGE